MLIQKHKNSGWSKNRDRNLAIVQHFQLRKSTRLTADEFQMSIASIRNVLNKLGVQTPREGRRHNPYSACDRNPDLVLKMCHEGRSLDEMARAVGTVGKEVKKFLRRNGVTKDFPKNPHTEERHYAWKGRLIDKDGYVLIHQKGHPNARKHTHYVFEHRLVMEEALGRILLPTEVVHHKDGNKQNNSIENLQLFDCNGNHLRFELAGRCPKWSPEGKERIQKANLQRWHLWRKSNQTQSEGDAPQCT